MSDLPEEPVSISQNSQSSGSHSMQALNKSPTFTEIEGYQQASSAIALEAQKIELEAQKIKLEEQKIELESYRQEVAFRRMLNLVQQSLRGSAGIVMLGAGIMFTLANNMIGPYMMGIGVAATSTSVKEAATSVRSPSKQISK